MKRFDLRVRLFAAGLSALAGYVDALGFLQLGGFFVSFMSGNSTRMSVGLAAQSSQAAIPAALIALFVVGAAAGSFTGPLARRHRRPAVLALMTALLTAGAAFN